uniref:non-specific serine/threonine protein kinase n=1 Tax=Kalanchoe fedtschenkoi TaxID=63787 RepID=A0A7N0TWD1_KALFE
MKIAVEVALSCLLCLVWIQHVVTGDASNSSDAIKWICTCTTAYQENQSSTLTSNCSTNCDCSSGESSGKWTCICASDKFPEISSNSSDSKCFASCHCNSGYPKATKPVIKHLKAVVIILLVCVVLVTSAFFTSVACYVYRREKCPIPPPLFTSDKETSYNSATLFISHRTKSERECTVNPVAGCFPNVSFLFRRRNGALPGTIYQFSYFELEVATNKFSESNLIGLGGSSFVYRGQLRDNRTVAIKRLKAQGGPEAESIFFTEIELLSRLHHCHVVPLLGYCSESRGKQAERLLVFEYVSNGNLRECLDGDLRKKMDWPMRVSIALGAARGLEYLHEAAAPKILHRDVKSTNILLDDNWRAKITDLGMAKRLRADGVPSCSGSPARMQGTFGYFAPEYAIVGKASLKSDVFSFGVVLLELITGRQPIHKTADKGEQSLVIWATPRLRDSKRVISELPDPDLKGNFPEEEIQIMAYLAKECLLLDPDSRPTMGEVVQILSTIAPDKSRWRNAPVTTFRRPTQFNNNESELKSPKQAIGHVDVEELKSGASTVSTDSPPITDSNHNSSTESIEKAGQTISSEYIEQLILLTSRARSWRAPENDHTVDLTEPRFESFCLKSPF